MSFAIGQKLWFVPSDSRYHHQSREMEIVKIGRKWVHVGDGPYPHRFERDDPDMIVDGGDYASPGHFYLSEAAWATEKERQKVWNIFRNAVYSAGTTPAVDVATIEEAAALLGLTLKIKEA